MNFHRQSLSQLAKQDPVMARVIKQAKLQALVPRKNYFQSLVHSIIGQQLSTKAAASIRNKFVDSFGGKFPSPEKVVKASNPKLRRAGLSKAKTLYIKGLAKAVKRGEVKFKKFPGMQDEEIIENLIQIKGIGRWTAEMFLIFSMCRPNVFSPGDLGLRNAIKKLYNIDSKLHTKKLQKLLASWEPHKSLASRHLWASLKNEP
jgi:DNA-3-methyladenine glycosylase II